MVNADAIAILVLLAREKTNTEFYKIHAWMTNYVTASQIRCDALLTMVNACAIAILVLLRREKTNTEFYKIHAWIPNLCHGIPPKM